MNNQQAYRDLWRKLESLMTLALKMECENMAPSDVQEIREFIEHNEFGVAYDLLSHALNERSIPVNVTTEAAMAEAARLMGL